MKKTKTNKFPLITAIMIILSINLAIASPIYYNINLHSSEDKITINSINIEFNQFEPQNFYNPGFNTQTLEIMDFNNNIITNIKFTIPNIEVYDIANNEGEIISGGMNNLTNTNFNLLIPYNENAKEIIIYNQDKQELAKISLAQFSKSPESVNYLKESIAINQQNQDNNKEIQQQTNDVNKESQKSKPISESDTAWKILLLILITLLIIFVFLIFKKRKLKDKSNKPSSWMC